MGNFRVVIDAVGGHGQDREKKDGEVVDFGSGSPETIVKDAVDKLISTGVNVLSAKVYHWPADTVYDGPQIAPVDGDGKECITDDLVTGVRKGSFM